MAMAIGLLVVLAMGGAASAQESTYTVTIENLTDGQPFTPPVLVAHAASMDLFEPGETASNEIAQVAENGNGDPLVSALNSAGATVVTGTAPIMPGETATLQITASAGDYLSAAFMLICTNDGFSGLDGIVLPAVGSTSVDAMAYDAGSEQNTEDFADIVPPCQGLIGVESADEGTGMSNPTLAEGGVITMHAGIQGTDLTIADHGWSGAVARITVTVGGDGMMDDADSMESDMMGDDMMMDDSMDAEMDAEGLPSAGTGPVSGGSEFAWVYFAMIAGVALVVVGGAARIASVRAK
jgi:hypothetical protein